MKITNESCAREVSSCRYDSMDEELKMLQDNADQEEKRALIDHYQAWRATKKIQLEAEREERERLTAHYQVRSLDFFWERVNFRPLPYCVFLNPKTTCSYDSMTSHLKEL